MKILVTGAAGFIGEHLVARLLERGMDVVGLDNLFDNNDLDLKSLRLAQLGIDLHALTPGNECSGNDGLRMIHGDIMDREAMYALFEREMFDAVFHLAAVTGSYYPKNEPAFCYDTNVFGTTNVLDAARRFGVQHVVFASSSAVYDRQAVSPLTEDASADHPMGTYAAAKRAAELICYAYARQFSLPVTVFRFFNVYGVRGRKDSIPMQMLRNILENREIRIMNNGRIIRDFTYIEDTAEAMFSALGNPPLNVEGVPYDLLNIGRSRPTSLANFINAAAGYMGLKPQITIDPTSPLNHGEKEEVYADTEKLERVLAYSPVWNYEEALPELIDWFRQNYKVTFDM